MPREERNTAIFTAYEDCEPRDSAAGEKSLLRAVLMNAMADLRKSGQAARRASEFFLSPDEEYIFSFRAICSFLNVDPQRVLMVAGLVKGQEEGRSAEAGDQVCGVPR